jgi:hypothetical protein
VFAMGFALREKAHSPGFNTDGQIKNKQAALYFIRCLLVFL